jgi:hypothetical protein
MIHIQSLTKKNCSYSNLFKYNPYALQNTRTVLLMSALYRLLHFLSRTLQWRSSEQQGYSLSQPNHNQKLNYNVYTFHRLHNEQLNGLYRSPNGLYRSPNGLYRSPNGLYCSPNGLYCSPIGIIMYVHSTDCITSI